MQREDRGRGFREERITKGAEKSENEGRREDRKTVEGGKERSKRTINLKPRRKLFERV